MAIYVVMHYTYVTVLQVSIYGTAIQSNSPIRKLLHGITNFTAN